jgi:hypothetical protein
MIESNKSNLPQVLIAAFYLSKYDRQALDALGYNSFHEAFGEIGAQLGFKPNTIKNRRDEFDPIHDNRRAGWYQREMRSSYIEVVQMFDGLGFEAMTELVRNVLSDSSALSEIEPMIVNLNAKDDTPRRGVFVPRAATGRKAEEHFMRWFNEGALPFQGTLLDRRDDGCGYDFLIKSGRHHRVEVKGLASENGGVLLTDKEWQSARRYKESYSLFIVSNINDDPQWTIISDPAEQLKATMNVRTVVQVNWQITSTELHRQAQSAERVER